MGPSFASTRDRIPTVNYTKVCRRFVQPAFTSSYSLVFVPPSIYSLSFVPLLYLPSHFLVIFPESTKQNIDTFEHVKVVKWKHLKLQMKRKKQRREKNTFSPADTKTDRQKERLKNPNYWYERKAIKTMANTINRRNQKCRKLVEYFYGEDIKREPSVSRWILH